MKLEILKSLVMLLIMAGVSSCEKKTKSENNEENETEHGLIWGDFTNPEKMRQISFVYANKAGTVSGEYSDCFFEQIISLNLKQGWNRVISSNYYDDENDFLSESLVTGSSKGFTWYVTEISYGSDGGDGPGGPGGPTVFCPDCGGPMPCECHP